MSSHGGTVIDVYGARRTAQVMDDTWGHLRPQEGRHDGWIVAAFSAYGGERVLINAEFGDVPDSPWLHQALLDLIDAASMEEGHVYRFSGALVSDASGVRFEGEWVTKGE